MVLGAVLVVTGHGDRPALNGSAPVREVDKILLGRDRHRPHQRPVCSGCSGGAPPAARGSGRSRPAGPGQDGGRKPLIPGSVRDGHHPCSFAGQLPVSLQDSGTGAGAG